MLYKESAIAVMVAVMLGVASLFGGLSTVPAWAAESLANKQISQGDDESMVIDAIELTAKKSTLRASGTVTIKVIQDGDVLSSAGLGTSSLDTTMNTLEVGLTNIEVTGSFEILVEYSGTGLVTVSDIGVIDGTEVAGSPDDEPEANDPEENEPNPPQEQEELENVIASKTVAPDGDDSMTVDIVEFTAKKSTLRASGTLTVAIVQEGEILDNDQISTSVLETSFTQIGASFDDLEVTDDFQVMFMYEGSGLVTVAGINVPGATEPAGDQGSSTPPPPPPPPAGTDSITVYAHRISSEFWGSTFTGANAQMWFTLHNSTGHIVFKGYFDESGTTVTGLNEGETHYIYASDCDECHLDDHDVVFDHWEDGGTDNPRTLTTLVDQHAWYRYEPDVGQ